MPRRDSLVFGSPYLGEDEISEVVATMRLGWLGTGRRVAAFEEAFRDHKGAANALALNSCTAALHVAMLAAGVKAGDEIIPTPLTFAATANSLVHTGATRVHNLPAHTHTHHTDTHGFRRGAFPVAEEIGRLTVSLPMSAKLTEENVKDVVEVIRAVPG